MPIVRGIRPKKPPLNAQQKELRFNHCIWLQDIIKRTNGNVIFICSDESPKQFGPGQSGGGKARVSRPMGVNANEYAMHDPPVQFSFSFWGAMCSDPSIPRPCIVWEPESQEQKNELQRKVIIDNEIAKERAEEKQRRAFIHGIAEYNHIKKVNDKINGDNERLKQQGIRKGRRHLRRPEQEFKYEVFTRGKGKGMDAAWYANHILKPLLYPYYKAVKEANPGKEVYLIEDNVSLHGSARRKLSHLAEELGILFVDHPPNSPDLHPIERCFGRLNHKVNIYDCHSASKEAKRQAKEWLLEMWREDKDLGDYILSRALNDSFLAVANACKSHGGNNNWTG